jgi:predicted ArsR family transcriptional regulator
MQITPMAVVEDRALSRALADDRRAQLVEELRATPDGLDIHELARRLGLHANTVRWHLGVLQDAGAVSSTAAPRSGRGRPRMLYRLERSAREGSRDEYRLLATILSGTLAEYAEGRERAAHAGRAWGRYLVERPLPLVRVTDAQATEQVVRLLDEQGFAAEADGERIRMRRCPFHDLAEAQPEIVCAVHRGLISGALEELGSELEVEGLDVFAEPNLCVAHLARRRS